ncbi:Peptidase family S41 [Clostridium cavendishii DSM 21758]|uniref:Peptidase family S41 n=1 Tax=Clostridium cavendishii DSM 21758 TaxID=1121302 RepID=A0A1M6GY01_9CLOT|nr:S41 family peptidase [Clostridium cavendishii]SHJ14807.1 Peptidase family S41 [Clostridium cavendishii DSM 21758]
MDKKIRFNKGQRIIAFIISLVFLFLSIPNLNVLATDKEFDNGSNVKIEKITNIQSHNLYKLCKVWGFVKYYHPKIATEDINWDYELFRIMPIVLNTKDDKELNKVLYEWINKFGDVKIFAQNESTEGEIYLSPDTSWIESREFLGDDLSNLLVKISKCDRNYEKHRYVEINPNLGNANFKSENSYSNMNYADSGYRLLALFRFWNMVDYFFPYRDIMDEDWDEVLKKFIPRILEGNDEKSYKLSMVKVSKYIQDSHVFHGDQKGMLYKYFGEYISPIKIDLIENKVVITNVNKDIDSNTKVKNGDIVLKIDNKDIFQLMKEKEEYISFSNSKNNFSKLSSYLLRSNKKEVEFEIERNGEIFKEKLQYTDDYSKTEVKEKSHKFIDNNIGYICPGSLKINEIHDVMKKFKDTKGLIIDLRYYPLDFIVYTLGAYLMPKAEPFTNITVASLKNPGEFRALPESLTVGYNNPDYYKGKVTILLNGESQSRPEFTAMALRCAPNSVIIGSDSVGADGDIIWMRLPGGLNISMTGIGIYYPDGRQTQKIGIKPDIRVTPTINGIKEGRDELLEKAIEVISQSKK